MKKREILLSILMMLLLWYIIAYLLNRPILPYPHRVFLVFARELFHELGKHLIASSLRVLLSIGIGIITASPLGIILGQSQRLDKIFLPFIYLLYPIPKVVFVPLAILFFGLGEFPKVLIIYVIIFFQIVVLVRDQAKTLKPELILSVRSLGAGRRALFRFVYLPSTLPAIFTAIRQSTGTAIAVLYLTELFGTKYGLGYYIFLTGSTLLDYSSMYAGILAMSLLGLGIYLGIEFLQKRLCPWLFIEMPH
jgi:ABC-type nitrate/sulfonate/bicarbonate transport system permease component